MSAQVGNAADESKSTEQGHWLRLSDFFRS
jgi:hypothetical protein